jgi:hypothetical protein
MVQGEEYPPNFKAPREVEKYDPKQDHAVWIDTYLEVMGITGHAELLATRYLSLLVDDNARSGSKPFPRTTSTSGTTCA